MQDWIIKEIDSEHVSQLASKHDLSCVAAQCLINRGITDPNEIQLHLSGRLSDLADPNEIPGITQANILLQSAIEQKRRIVLFGDYDVDGMTGCAILSLFLKRFGLDVDIYIPDRMTEGYGLNIEALEKIYAKNTDILIAIDNGTNAFHELHWAMDHGMQVIVIDHHESPTEIPPCQAFINPKHPQSIHSDRNFCSVGLVFNLVMALRSQLRSAGFFKDQEEPDLKEFLDLVCLGTIADMVPLLKQNRLLVRYGLKALDRNPRPGVQALKFVSGIQEKPIGTWEVSFQLAPRLNAAGRMADAMLGLRLLMTQDLQEAMRLAKQLNDLNQERRAIETCVLDQACEQISKQPEDMKHVAIVVASKSWHPGVIGIVASRLTEQYRRPAFVIALDGDIGRGSARGYGNVNLFDALSDCSEHLIRCGGHQAAAGLTIRSDQIPSFTERVQEVIASKVPHGGLKEQIHIDQFLATSDITPRMIHDLERLSPWGMDYPAPLFVTEPVRLLSPRIVGNGHLKVTVAGQDKKWSAFGFGLAEAYETMEGANAYQVVYQPGWNEFRGERDIQLNIKSLRAVSS